MALICSPPPHTREKEVSERTAGGREARRTNEEFEVGQFEGCVDRCELGEVVGFRVDLMSKGGGRVVISRSEEKQRGRTHQNDPSPLVSLVRDLRELEPEDFELRVEPVPEVVPPRFELVRRRGWGQVGVKVVGCLAGCLEEPEAVLVGQGRVGQDGLEEELGMQSRRHRYLYMIQRTRWEEERGTRAQTKVRFGGFRSTPPVSAFSSLSLTSSPKLRIRTRMSSILQESAALAPTEFESIPVMSVLLLSLCMRVRAQADSRLQRPEPARG